VHGLVFKGWNKLIIWTSANPETNEPTRINVYKKNRATKVFEPIVLYKEDFIQWIARIVDSEI
jgi:hypothetical protein